MTNHIAHAISTLRPVSNRGEALPWTYALRTKKSKFTPLEPRYKAFNLEVDFASSKVFGDPYENVPADSLIHSDFQKSPHVSPFGHLGSCRAGFYKGHYLKGVGRTPLLKNWDDKNLVYQSTGHLSAYEGIREWVVTSYFRALRHAEAIVPCETVFVKPLARQLRKCTPLPIESNLKFQLLSLKKAGFARPSNFIWMLDHLTPKHGLIEFFGLMHYFLQEPGERRQKSAGPSSVVELFSQAFDRGLSHFKTYFESGVRWIHCYNNVTLDGRFVDLDSPEIFGAPFIGIAAVKTGTRTNYSFMGLEVFQYVRELREFAEFLEHRLAFLLLKKEIFTAAEGMIAEEFLSQWRRLRKNHPLFSDDWIKTWAFRMVSGALEIPGSAAQDLKKFIDADFLKTVKLRNAAGAHEFAGRRVSFPLHHGAIHTPSFMPLPPRHFERGRHIHGEIIASLEREGNLGRFIDQLADVPGKIRN